MVHSANCLYVADLDFWISGISCDPSSSTTYDSLSITKYGQETQEKVREIKRELSFSFCFRGGLIGVFYF